MILSFHPMAPADIHRLCAGRDPDDGDLAAIRAARAVILPQGCRESLYIAAARNCMHVFPDYAARFAFPGKIGQARLFAETGTDTPETRAFRNLSELRAAFPHPVEAPPLPYPFVFKYDWGGEGDFVRFPESPDDLSALLAEAGRFERTGQPGFLFQEYVPGGERTLRVVVIHDRLFSYLKTGISGPCANRKQGAEIGDAPADMAAAGEEAVREFRDKTGINLAGFDLIFPSGSLDPLFLEINWFFGRGGLGGSDRFYELLQQGIDTWLAERSLSRRDP